MADLGDRRTYLGATDIAAIVGVSPWASPIDVYREKVEGIGATVSAEMEAGAILEPAIVEMYERQTGRRTFIRNEIVHPVYPFLRFHPDRLVYGDSRVFDAKATWQYGGGKWGEPGTDQVPPQVRVQMVIYNGVTKRDIADIGLLRRPPLALYHVEADPPLYEALIAEAVRFWRENIEKRVPPPPDGTESYRRFLTELHPHASDVERIATPEEQLLLDELRAATSALKQADGHKTLVENRIREAMGDAAALVAPGARVSYRNQAPATSWKGVAELIASDHEIELDAYVAASKEGKTGPRVFRVTWTEVEEEAA